MMAQTPYSPQNTPPKKDDLVCYCYSYSKKDIERDFFANSMKSSLLENITREKKAGNCDCAKKNPKGR